jgi:UDPglucose--hexose-1-phosphate uridylyltransferase
MNELRRDILLERWVAVLLESKEPSEYFLPPDKGRAEKSCILCSGRESETPSEITSIRKTGTRPNTPGWWVRAIPSFAPLFQIEGNLERSAAGIYDKMNGIGANEILIESPEHTAKPEDLGHDQMVKVITLYRDRIVDLNRDLRLRYILIYKNSGLEQGETFFHPVSFLVATPIIPKKIKDELENARQYYDYKDRCIFCDIISEELKVGERVVLETKHFMSFCPYASSFPFESWIIPKRHSCEFHEITNEEIEDMGFILMGMLKKLRGAFEIEPPINYFLHTAPSRVPRRNHWHTLGDDYHWHLEIIPRIVNSSGFELGSGCFVLTTLPEKAAKYLREVE